jgi:hypothetical protein
MSVTLYSRESEGEYIPRYEKPSVLFHASRNTAIETFEPRAEKIRDVGEGPKVFATPSRAMAGAFLVESDDSWVAIGSVDGVPHIVISDEERFRHKDTGGVIYSLPSDSFESDHEKGLRELEWTSVEPVTPTEKEFVPCALTDMIAHGVQVYFVDEKTFNEFQCAPDGGETILARLVPMGEGDKS